MDSLPPPRSLDRRLTAYPVPSLQPQYPDEEVDLDLRSLWGMVYRHRLLVACSVLIGLAVALVYNWRTTPIYEAVASIRIDPGRGAAASATGTDIFGTDPWNDEIETEMEVLKSRVLAGRVADSLKLQITLEAPRGVSRDKFLKVTDVDNEVVAGTYALRRLGDRSFALFDESDTRRASLSPGETVRVNGFRFELASAAGRYDEIRFRVRSRASAAEVIEGGLDVRRPHDYANFLEIQYRGPDPRLAAAIPNAVAEQFITHRQHEQKSRARSIVSFLREQIDSLSIQLGASENELRDFRERSQAVNLHAEGESRIDQVAALQGQRDVIQSERVALGRLLRQVEATPSEDSRAPSPYRKLMAFPTLLSSAATNTMLTTLVDLENQRANLLLTRSPRNPDVVALSDRVKDIESQLHTIVTTYYEGLGGQVASLGAAVGQGRGALGQIPAKEAEFVRLNREAQLLEQIHTLLQTRLREAQITQAADESSVRIVDRAEIPSSPIKPDPQRNVLFGLLLGLMAGVGIAYVREHVDDTVHTRDKLQEISRVPVLGLIPRMRNGPALVNGFRKRGLRGSSRRVGNGKLPNTFDRARLIVATDPRHAVAEAFRSLRTNITFSIAEEIPKTLLITSAKIEDGKTTSAINLAIAFAQQGLHVLLIDADMRKGIIHRIFGHTRAPGASNLLVERMHATMAIRAVRLNPTTAFDILPTGVLPPNPAELLGSSRMGELIRELERVYDGIIIDTPPLTLVTDAAVLANHADGVLVVARAGQTEERALDFAMEQLRNVNAPVLGTILNDIDYRDRRSSVYDYYAYQYEYSADEADEI